jgi:hypothetical protein
VLGYIRLKTASDFLFFIFFFWGKKLDNSSTERKQNHWPTFKISTGWVVHCRAEDVHGMRLCSGVWPRVLGMSYTSVLYQFQSVGA